MSASAEAQTSASIALFHSDSCSGDLLATVGPGTNCEALGAQISSSVWGVRIDGQCVDISDTDVRSACNRFKGGGTALFHSDSCSGDLLAAVGPGTDCNALGSQISSSVWGIRVNGQCYDVSDLDAKSACQRYQGGGAALFHSDSCAAGNLIAVVGSGSDCAALGSQISSSVWGVQVNGTCLDISDTDVKSACERYGRGAGSGSTMLYHSDSCSGDVLAAIGPGSDCSALGSQISSSVWGLKIDGQCYDIPDSDVKSACNRYKGGGTMVFHSDSCGGELLAALGPGSDCDVLGSQISSSVWGVRSGTDCYDVSDVDMKTACQRYKGGSAALFHSDSCAAGNLLALVGSGTDCTALGSQISSSVWGVRADGQCSDVSDTDVKSACLRYGGGH